MLQWFAKLWEIDSEDYWGYITNCGTEGNLHGILVGRENHPEGMSRLGSLLHNRSPFSLLYTSYHILRSVDCATSKCPQRLAVLIAADRQVHFGF